MFAKCCDVCDCLQLTTVTVVCLLDSAEVTWDDVSQHLQQSLTHLETLSHPVIAALRDSQHPHEQTYAQQYDLSRSQPHKVSSLSSLFIKSRMRLHWPPPCLPLPHTLSLPPSYLPLPDSLLSFPPSFPPSHLPSIPPGLLPSYITYGYVCFNTHTHTHVRAHARSPARAHAHTHTHTNAHAHARARTHTYLLKCIPCFHISLVFTQT